MKRCPQCEFIYEDDQDLCDMDGGELEPVPAAPLGLVARPKRPPAARLPRKFLALLISGVILTAILASGYYVQSSQTATGRFDSPPAAGANADSHTATAPPPEAPDRTPGPPPETPRPAPPPPPKTKARTPVEPPRKSTGGAAKLGSPAVKPPAPSAARRGERARSPENADGRSEPKKGSKLGAALKKAGRVLKKPFGF